MVAHSWPSTHASVLFGMADIDPVSGRRFATARGIAFEAKETGDKSWHGFPVPWESVPPAIKDLWLDAGVVTRRQVKAFLRFEKEDIHWALGTDDP